MNGRPFPHGCGPWSSHGAIITAILFKRSFLLFLLSPFFPVIVSVIAGGIGSEVRDSVAQPELGVAMASGEVDAMLAAAPPACPPNWAGAAPQLKVIKRLAEGESINPQASFG